MTQVKLCGMRTLEHARAALDAGAEYVGFVLAPARRQVSPELVREIIFTLGPSKARYVGVFVNPEPEEAQRIARYAGLDIIQLSGSERPEDVSRVGLPVFKVVHVRPDSDLEADLQSYSEVSEMIVLDTYKAAAAGGTGEAFEWSRAIRAARSGPIMLAGGLHPENVATAIRIVAPAAVDVSSGIETDGQKDSAKMRAFVAAVRGAER